MIGKIIFVIYIISISIIGFCGTYYESKFSFNWVFTLSLILYVISPIIAKFCGLI